MKKCICLSFAAILLTSFSALTFALSSPYQQYLFYTVSEMVEWINTVDINTIDAFSNSESYSYRSFIEDIRRDGEILVPKYNGQYFPIQAEPNHGIQIWPKVKYKKSEYWRSINYDAKIGFGTSIRVYVHRIDDEHLELAQNNYEKYIQKGHSYLGKLSRESDRYMRIDRYDVQYSVLRELFDEAVLQGLSFDKIKLSDIHTVAASYTMDDVYVYSADESTAWSGTAILLICVGLGLCAGGVILFATIKKHK